MFDFHGATNQQLVDMIRALHEDQNKVIPASSTLLRLKKDELLRRVSALMGTKMGVDDRGEPVLLNEANADFAADAAAALTEVLDQGDAEEFQAALDDEGVDAEVDDSHGIDDEGWDGVAGGVYVREAPANNPPVEPTTALASKTRGARARHGDDAVITVVATKNPKREGSSAYTRWNCLKTGQTVGEYVAEVIRVTGSDDDARGTLTKAVRRGEVTISGGEG